ncbi:FMN reductase (NADPH) [Bacillus xiamenensis]|uniref:FMN reductase (NADPH) n=1 Tax=Bacillus xiamenensis TaxID=1178537 RepID=A0AAC9IG22_9BACI|nr:MULTISPECIES: NADPH-dependent FMN reductase [Bacillus]AOZ88970.1 FMN reductase (NADPH) [Bacillus xiamenensis]EKF37340.1 FMN reductase NADPH-dependent [Bacillus xiamenensis]MBG9910270.1 FMN reductase [Bacillus xiamenensis]MCW1834904.1 NADPH-dependent FMN reductase [Bacillus xiamenensis]MCY9575096.1 NADPH-dependent FMN reductase [Bacillus xiamenensis]
MTKVTIIAGGHSVQSRLTGVLQHVKHRLTLNGIDVHIIQVHQLPSDALIGADFSNEDIVKAIGLVNESDGVIVLTPVYKASFSGILKTFLDLLPQKAFQGKPVLPCVLGGTYGHLLVIEYALKPIIHQLGATAVQSGVYVVDHQVTKQDSDSYVLDLDATNRLNLALSQYQSLIGGTAHVAHP